MPDAQNAVVRDPDRSRLVPFQLDAPKDKLTYRHTDRLSHNFSICAKKLEPYYSKRINERVFARSGATTQSRCDLGERDKIATLPLVARNDDGTAFNTFAIA